MDPVTSSPTDPGLPVVLERDGAVATVRLNRPQAMNALNTPLKEGLLAALKEVAADSAVRVVVLTGTGRAFCAGQDLEEHVGLLQSASADLVKTLPEHYNPILMLLATMNKPVIAALNGIAVGAGASLTFAADLRVLSDRAGYNLGFAAIGLSCDTGASWTLPRLVGTARAKELLLMPSNIDAARAQELGLATSVVPHEQFETSVRELAQRLAAGPTTAYASIREAVHYASSHDLAASLEHEIGLMQRTGSTADHRAAVEAFLAKEAKPEFTGA